MRPLATRPRLLLFLAPALAILLLVGFALWLWSKRPRLDEEEVRQAVYTTIQREAPASFLVTGTIDVVGTATGSNRRVLLPGLLNLDLGTNRARVRMPARVSYGIDVSRIRTQNIRLLGDTVVEITIPELSVYAVDPNLRAVEVETERGWARLSDDAQRGLERRALASLDSLLRVQAEAHLSSSVQPRINTGQALERLLRPVLKSAGMQEPRFRFLIGEGIVMER